MKLDAENKRVYVRQSWLNDVMLCPERARLGVQFPQWRRGSTATMIGTAIHHGIEMVLKNPDVEFSQMAQVIHARYGELVLEPHKEQGVDPQDVPTFLDNMAAGFFTEILPHVQRGGLTEWRFAVPLNLVAPNGWAVWLEGTADYVSPDGVIWDWKTSGRAYSERDKQSQAIQPTVYALAAHRSGLLPDGNNVDFRYGVMLRQKSVKTQIVRVHRNMEHMRWLESQVARVVNMAMRLGMDSAWLMNDQNNLCSAKWCDYWSICKGAIVQEQSLVVRT